MKENITYDFIFENKYLNGTIKNNVIFCTFCIMDQQVN